MKFECWVWCASVVLRSLISLLFMAGYISASCCCCYYPPIGCECSRVTLFVSLAVPFSLLLVVVTYSYF